MRPRQRIGVCALTTMVAAASCKTEEPALSRRGVAAFESPAATTRLTELTRQFGLSPAAIDRFALDEHSHLRVITETRPLRATRISLPLRANGQVKLEDITSGMSILVALEHVHDAPIELARGYAIYRNAFEHGDLLQRVDPEGTEDFVVFARRPPNEELRYDVDVRRVAGLRLVSNTLEFLDEKGSPQLRVAPPYVIDADQKRRAAKLSVDGCAYDTNPAGPWGRDVTRPGAARCSVRVAWSQVAYPALVDPAWQATGSLTSNRDLHTATLLGSGRVLVTGGNANRDVVLSSAELYDPAAGTFAATGSMFTARAAHTATLLGSGKVLIVGGTNSERSTAYNDAELYDPATGSFAVTGSLGIERYFHTANLLPSGKVLVAGGFLSASSTSTAEIYDPSGAGSFSTTASMGTARGSHTASTLVSGKVLIAGGFSTVAMASIASAEIFDPAGNAGTGTFVATGALAKARHDHTASVLPSGKVLLAMGSGNAYLASAEIFDPAGAGSFTATGTGLTPRLGHTATVLPTGKVLIAGGLTNGVTVLASTELFDPLGNGGVGNFAAAPPMANARIGTATLLPGGKVLALGGAAMSAEVFGGTTGERCTGNGGCLAGFCADGYCCNTACAGGGCDRCDLPGKEGTCTTAPAGNPGAGPACAFPLACDGVNVTCPTSCTTDAACAPSHFCSTDGTCTARKAQGAICTPAGQCRTPGCRECASGFCVDGVCCDTACSGTCQACTSTLTQNARPDGTCGPAKNGFDPRNECAPSTAMCGADGQCNGTGACRLAAPAGITCADGKVCDGFGKCKLPPVATCDGDHTTTRIDGKPQDCSPYKCSNEGMCIALCKSVDDCVAPSVCDPGGTCVAAVDEMQGGSGGCALSTKTGAASSLAWLAIVVGLGLARRRRLTEISR